MKNRSPHHKKSFSALRLLAEKTFAIHPEKSAMAPPVDSTRILHELQIHQIELELQNEELCQAQEALELTRARYFDLYDLAPVGYITLNSQGIIQEANLTAAQLLGVYKSALIHQPLSNFIYPEDQDTYYRQRKLLRDTHTPQCSEVRLIRSPHEIWWGRLEAAPGHNQRNADPEIRVVLSDITKITLQKAQLHQQTRQVNQLETLYQISQAANASLDLNATLQRSLELTCAALNAAEGIIVLLEPFTDQSIFTKTKREIKDPGQICRTSIDNLTFQYNQTAWIKDLSPQTPEYMVWNSQFDFPVRSLIGVPLIDNNKRIGVLEAFSSTHDHFTQEHIDLLNTITAIITGALKNTQLYTDLQEALKKYEQTQTRLIWAEKMGALGRLSASIAHEINNPLQAMQGYQEMIETELRTPHSPARLLQYVKIIHTEMERIAHIIREMEDFYRPSREEKSLTDLRETMKSMLELCSPKLKKSRINVVENWSTAVIPIWANTDQIKQLFLNLLLDSIDALPEGGEIRVSAELDLPLPQAPETPSVRLEFQDNGIGMPAETLAHLFEPFFTTKPHNSGLGLSICYTIVTQHRGEIKATSQVGKGTTFTIWLPVGVSPHPKHP